MDRKAAQNFIELVDSFTLKDKILYLELLYKHYYVVKAYAEGEDIQVKSENPGSEWLDIEDPSFDSSLEYRVKPKTKCMWYRVYKTPEGFIGVWVGITRDEVEDVQAPHDGEWVNSPSSTTVERPYRSFK